MANNIKGITIEFKGDTTSLGKALNDVNKQIRTTDSALRDVDKALKLDPGNVELLAQKEALLAKQIEQTKEKLDLQKRAAAEAGKALAEGTISQEEYAKLTAQVAQTANKLGDLENAAKGAGGELDAAGKDAKTAGDNAKKSGDDAQDAGDKWEKFGDAAKAACEVAVAAVAAVSAAVVAAGGALVNCTVDAAGFADEVLTLSSVTGMTTDEVQALQYSAELLDVSFETIEGSMRKNIRSMSSAVEGTGAAAEAYAELGVAVADSDGNLRDSEQVFWETIDALGQVEDRTQRDALAMEIFGKSAQELNPLIEAGSEGFADMAEQAEEAGYIMSGETLDAFGEFDDQLQQLKGGTTAAKNALGTVLLPILSDLAGEGVDLLGQFTNGILDANGDVEQMAAVIEDILPQVIDLFNQYLPMIIELGGTIIETLATAILENLPTILDSAISLIETIATGIVDHLADFAPVIADLIVTIATFIVNNLPTIINAAIEIVLAVVNGIAEAMPELIPAIASCILTITEAIIDHLPELIESGIDLIVALIEGLLQAIPQIWAEMPQIISAIVDSLAQLGEDLPEMASEWGWDLIESFASSVTQAIPNLVSAVSSAAQTVSDYLHFSVPDKGPLSGDFANSGADMIEGFIDSMNSEKYDLQRALVQTGDIIYGGMTQDYTGQLAGISSQIGSIGGSNGTYVINVMVGNTKLAQAVISAQQMEAYRSGGV